MDLDELISRIKQRPNLFFRETSVIHLRIYLSGFYFCRSFSEDLQNYESDFFRNFSAFVLEKNNEEDFFQSWDEYLAEQNDSWNLFFVLYGEFRNKTGSGLKENF